MAYVRQGVLVATAAAVGGASAVALGRADVTDRTTTTIRRVGGAGARERRLHLGRPERGRDLPPGRRRSGGRDRDHGAPREQPVRPLAAPGQKERRGARIGIRDRPPRPHPHERARRRRAPGRSRSGSARAAPTARPCSASTASTTSRCWTRPTAPRSLLDPLPLGSVRSVQVGDPVVAIGNPLGEYRSITEGIVSAKRRQINSLKAGYKIYNAIQTDAAINHGNSGGPLIDRFGSVVGITNQILTGTNNPTSGSIGIGFAVPIDAAHTVARQIIATGQAVHTYLGIAGAAAQREPRPGHQPARRPRRPDRDRPARLAGGPRRPARRLLDRHHRRPDPDRRRRHHRLHRRPRRRPLLRPRRDDCRPQAGHPRHPRDHPGRHPHAGARDAGSAIGLGTRFAPSGAIRRGPTPPAMGPRRPSFRAAAQCTSTMTSSTASSASRTASSTRLASACASRTDVPGSAGSEVTTSSRPPWR